MKDELKRIRREFSLSGYTSKENLEFLTNLYYQLLQIIPCPIPKNILTYCEEFQSSIDKIRNEKRFSNLSILNIEFQLSFQNLLDAIDDYI